MAIIIVIIIVFIIVINFGNWLIVDQAYFGDVFLGAEIYK